MHLFPFGQYQSSLCLVILCLMFVVGLMQDERGQPTISGKVKGEQDDPEKKKKKKHRHRHKDKDKEREKDKDKEKKKDRDKEKVRDKDKDKDRVKGENGDDRSRKHRKKVPFGRT